MYLYGIGPDGKYIHPTTGEFNYGLYKIIFFPYDPLILHDPLFSPVCCVLARSAASYLRMFKYTW